MVGFGWFRGFPRAGLAAMMLLPVLRPVPWRQGALSVLGRISSASEVSKSAGRLLLAGGRELEQLGTPDHGVSLEAAPHCTSTSAAMLAASFAQAPATAVYQPQPQLYAPSSPRC